MSSPRHPHHHRPSSRRAQPWEAWAVASLKSLKASPAGVIHFASEADVVASPASETGELDWLASDISAADLLAHDEIEEAVADGEDLFRISPEPVQNSLTGVRPASLQGLLRVCKAFGTPEGMTTRLFTRGALTLISTGDPGLNLTLVSLLQDPATLIQNDKQSRPCIMLSELAGAGDYRKAVQDIWSGLHRDLREALQTARPIVLIATDISSCPREITRLRPEVIDLPRLDHSLILAHLRLSHSETTRISEPLVVQHLPSDAALSRLTLEEFAGCLRRETPADVARDLARRCASLVMTQGISDFPIERDVRDTIEQMLADLRDWQRGDLPWSDVTRGLLLAGPPGTGKTEIARLLAAEGGLTLRAASVASWHASGERFSGFMKSMHEFFASAAAAAPCIAFIDELDAIGDRNRPHDHNSSYTESVVTALLEQLDGFAAREGVILLSATNHFDRIDAAIRRPGRFDRTLLLRNPSPAVMPQVLRWHLRGELLDADITQIAAGASGMSGADVAAMVRDARAQARKARRNLRIEDLEAAIVTLRPPASAAMRWRIAVHESGHAIVAHELGRGQPKFMALTGGGGIMERECISDDQTRGAFDAEIATILAGRAAEKLMLGSASAGAGGTVDSDLARASATACAIELSFGLGECRAWVTTADRAILRLANDVALRQTVETQLQAAETTALDILRNRQGTIIELATALLSKGVLDHDMIRDILLRGVVETCEL